MDRHAVDIESRVYAATYEIEFLYDDNIFFGKNKSQVEDIKKWYVIKMHEYLSQTNISVIKKSINRMERIDIKPQIIEYDFLLDGSLQITVDEGPTSNLKPENIMIGYNEYIDQEIEFNIKRTKILFL
ncbi:hypothetical protein D3C76_1313260 [compost metagenome]